MSLIFTFVCPEFTITPLYNLNDKLNGKENYYDHYIYDKQKIKL